MISNSNLGDTNRNAAWLSSLGLGSVATALLGDAASQANAADAAGLIDTEQVTGDAPCTDCVGADNALAPNGAAIGTLAAVENNFVTDFHALLEDAGHQFGEPVNSSVHALTTFGEAVGFGDVGVPPDDLLSSVLAAPSAAVDGEATPAACNIVGQASNTISDGGTFANTILDTVNLANPLNAGLVGQSASLLHDVTSDVGSVTGLAATIIDDATQIAGNVGPLASAVGNLADNLTGDAAKMTGSAAGAVDDVGHLAGSLTDDVANIAGNVGGAIDGIANIVGNAIDNIGNLTGNGGGTIGDIGNIGGNFGNSPLIEVDGNGPSGESLQTVVNPGWSQSGALIDASIAGNGDSAQSHNLIDIDAGPQSKNASGSVNVLSSGDAGSGNTAQANVIDVGPDGPRLLDADLASDPNLVPAVVVDHNYGAPGMLDGDHTLAGLSGLLPHTISGYELMI
jgi:hypothetical protein